MPDKRYWTTPDQRDWLKEQLPAYLEAQKNGRLPIYWPTLYSLWFLKWPARKPIENDLTDSAQEDKDDIVEDAGSDVDTTTPVDPTPAINTMAPKPLTTLGKRKARADHGHKKKQVSCILY